MASDADRPVPRDKRIDPSERYEILRELLDVERARLKQAVQMEKDRNIVFPETTVIIKDVERLLVALGGAGVEAAASTTDREPDELDALLAEANSL